MKRIGIFLLSFLLLSCGKGPEATSSEETPSAEDTSTVSEEPKSYFEAFDPETDFYRVKDPDDINPDAIVPSTAPQKKAKPEEDPLYYHGYFIEKRFHPYSRWHRVEEIRHDFKNARRVGNWLETPYGRKRFDLCTVERTTKRKIK